MTRDLIMRVSKINHQAELFMARKVPLLVARGKLTSPWPYENPLKRLNSYDRLIDTFIFRETPQGFYYWKTIATQLGEW